MKAFASTGTLLPRQASFDSLKEQMFLTKNSPEIQVWTWLTVLLYN